MIQQHWTTFIGAMAFFYLTIEFVLIKGLGRKAFLLSFFYWIRKMVTSNREIKEMLQKKQEANIKRDEFMYGMAASIERIERKIEKVQNEVTFNGGKITLVDGLKEVLNNQAIYSSEREAALYIDPQPTFKTDAAGRVTFVNKAYLDMVGCEDAEQLMGYSYLVVIPDENKDLVEKTAKRFAESPAPFHGDFTYQHLKTKEYIYTNVQTQLIKDVNRKFVGTLGIVTVIN